MGGMARPAPPHSSGAGTFAPLANRVRLAGRRTRTGCTAGLIGRAGVSTTRSPLSRQAGAGEALLFLGPGRGDEATLLLLSPVENPSNANQGGTSAHGIVNHIVKSRTFLLTSRRFRFFFFTPGYLEGERLLERRVDPWTDAARGSSRNQKGTRWVLCFRMVLL